MGSGYGEKGRALLDFLQTKEARGLTAAQIAARFNVHPQSVYTARRKLRKQSPTTEASGSLDAQEAALAPRLEGLSPSEQRLVLSNIAVSAEREGDRVAALSALQRLDASQGVKSNLGPPPPMTDDEKVERLGRLMEACGRGIVLKAMRLMRAH